MRHLKYFVAWSKKDKWSTKHAFSVLSNMVTRMSWDVTWPSIARNACVPLSVIRRSEAFYHYQTYDPSPHTTDSLIPQCKKLGPRKAWQVWLHRRPQCLFSHSFLHLNKTSDFVSSFSQRLMFRVLTTASMSYIFTVCWNLVDNPCKDWILRTSYST